MRKRDLWLWDPHLLKPIVFWATLLILAAVAVCYPFIGPQALLILLLAITGPIIGLTCIRSSSHNIVVGANHGYSSYGGLIVGWENRI